MRKLVFTMLMLLTLSLSAQNDGVIKFLGIPVDGTKEEMISKLKAKGFTYDKEFDLFKGKFNGEDVQGIIQAYNDKVYNIRFMYDSHGFPKSLVIRKFNSLVFSFETNEKYLSNINIDKITYNIDSYLIDEYEDIGYEMNKGKLYKALYYYKYGKNLSDTTGLYQFKCEAIKKYQSMANSLNVDIYEFLNDSTAETMFFMHKLEQDYVHFYILEGIDPGKYNIVFEYYNRRNAPNGEDL